jgi:hypothetical protein
VQCVLHHHVDDTRVLFTRVLEGFPSRWHIVEQILYLGTTDKYRVNDASAWRQRNKRKGRSGSRPNRDGGALCSCAWFGLSWSSILTYQLTVSIVGSAYSNQLG